MFDKSKKNIVKIWQKFDLNILQIFVVKYKFLFNFFFFFDSFYKQTCSQLTNTKLFDKLRKNIAKI